MSETMRLISTSIGDTLAIGAAVARAARGGDIVALSGELGAGKTQFVRGMAQGMGIDTRRVTSPTFVLMHEYEPASPDALTLVHIDAYRVSSLGDLESLGWERDPDLLRNALVAVEWADRLGESLGTHVLSVRIAHIGDEARRLTLTPAGRWLERWPSLRGTLAAYEEQVQRTPCPICKRPVSENEPTYPFCSKRCRTIDLGKWINGSYQISRPIEQSDLEEGVD